MADTAALSFGEFRAALAAVVTPGASGLVVAVSGGPDSMALMHGIAALAQAGGLPPVIVGTVDHGLRAGSDDVAKKVSRAATALGFPVRILLWDGEKPRHGIQAAARAARYTLLATLCAELGADHLLTGHTADDQAETVLMRLARGSGTAGLAAMRGRTALGSVTLARPLLAFPKARLLATCATLGIEADLDPANADPRFERARLRAAAPLLEEAGLGRAALLRLAERSARAEDALEAAAADAFARHRVPDGLRWAALAAGPDEITVRVLARALDEKGCAPERLVRLERAVSRLTHAARDRTECRLTLGGAVLSYDGADRLTMREEGPRRRGRTAAFTTLPRDGVAAGGVPWQG